MWVLRLTLPPCLHTYTCTQDLFLLIWFFSDLTGLILGNLFPPQYATSDVPANFFSLFPSSLSLCHPRVSHWLVRGMPTLSNQQGFHFLLLHLCVVWRLLSCPGSMWICPAISLAIHQVLVALKFPLWSFRRVYSLGHSDVSDHQGWL